MVEVVWEFCVHKFYLPRCTVRPVYRWTFFGFAEILVVRVAAPQLLTRVICSKLRRKQNSSFWFQQEAFKYKISVNFLHTRESCHSWVIILGWQQIYKQIHQCWDHVFNLCWTYSSAHFITDPKIKAALLIHRVIDSRELRKLGPLVFKRIIQQAVVRTEETWRNKWEKSQQTSFLFI